VDCSVYGIGRQRVPHLVRHVIETRTRPTLPGTREGECAMHEVLQAGAPRFQHGYAFKMAKDGIHQDRFVILIVVSSLTSRIIGAVVVEDSLKCGMLGIG
jgi:hypothetical protein